MKATKFKILGLALLMMVALNCQVYGEKEAREYDFGNYASKHLTIKAWKALSARDYEAVFAYTETCIDIYREEAMVQQRSLKNFAPTGSEAQYEALNNVGTSWFIKGEAFLAQGKVDEARVVFKTVIEKFSFAQYWDPRGWFWKPAEIAKVNLDKIERSQKREEPETEEPQVEAKTSPRPKKPLLKGPAFALYDRGTEDIVNYAKYGKLSGIGTADYSYKITDRKGLAKAVGEGIYPSRSVFMDPEYQRLKREGKLEGTHWEFLHGEDLAANFYKWATTGEEAGVKLYYTALILEGAGLFRQAIKAYYACLIHYPKSVGWTYWGTPWYVAKGAVDKLRYLTCNHPELGMRLDRAKVLVKNGFDKDTRNDIVIVDPGSIVRCKPEEVARKEIDLSELKLKKVTGKGKVRLVQFENGHWQLLVDGKPYIIKGMAYIPNKVGQSPDEGTLDDWMQADYNRNGLIDAPYEAWVDKNLNNRRDQDEPVVGDFQLMKEMGVNTIRVYHYASNKELLRDLYKNYGIMVMMGDFLGAYAVGSGASWYEGTDYANPEHRKDMMESVRSMVMAFKDEPYILMWVLGNENNYGVANNSNKIPKTYYSFINKVARMIKSIDPEHPVAVSNGDTLFLDIIAKASPDVDIFGCNSYRGDAGFEQSLFSDVINEYGKPVVITEYGCAAYVEGRDREDAEFLQSEYHRGNWEGMMRNSCGSGAGNAIGGVVFEWVDEWWKAYEPSIHDYKPLWAGPFPDGWMHEEWLGITTQGDGNSSPYLRQLRKVYYMYQKIWK